MYEYIIVYFLLTMLYITIKNILTWKEFELHANERVRENPLVYTVFDKRFIQGVAVILTILLAPVIFPLTFIPKRR